MKRTDEELKAIIDAARSGDPPWWTGPELENLLKDIIDSKQTIDPLLPDASFLVAGPNIFDPASNTSTLTFPEEYIGRDIRIFRNKILFKSYNRTSTGISLNTPGDVWIQGESIDVQNY